MIAKGKSVFAMVDIKKGIGKIFQIDDECPIDTLRSMHNRYLLSGDEL